jgi:hypothetical protein
MPNYRFGKHPPKVDYRTLRFKNYLTPAIAAPPATYNVLTTSVYPKLKTNDPTKLFPMDGNDTLGDCTIAALAHADIGLSRAAGYAKTDVEASCGQVVYASDWRRGLRPERA